MPAVLAPAEETVLTRVLPELVQLSPAARLEAISQLVESMRAEPEVAPRKTLLDFAGAWADMPGTDEEIIESIRGARHFSRPPVSFDED